MHMIYLRIEWGGINEGTQFQNVFTKERKKERKKENKENLNERGKKYLVIAYQFYFGPGI